MKICAGCGGVLGRDCFNEMECIGIGNSQEQQQYQQVQTHDQRIKQLEQQVHEMNRQINELHNFYLQFQPFKQ